MDTNDLINWSKVSVFLAGKPTMITKKYHPKKHAYKLALLNKKLSEWMDQVDEIKTLEE